MSETEMQWILYLLASITILTYYFNFTKKEKQMHNNDKYNKGDYVLVKLDSSDAVSLNVFGMTDVISEDQIFKIMQPEAPKDKITDRFMLVYANGIGLPYKTIGAAKSSRGNTDIPIIHLEFNHTKNTFKTEIVKE